MKKKDVFTLLLACGLAVGGNGMPVLAAEAGMDVPAAAVPKQEASESVSANDMTGEPEKTAVSGEETSGAGENAYVSRIVSFTDYTGMRVTYDANVSRNYVYEVADGVLTAVKEQGTLTPIDFEGNVELKQPEEGEKYTSVSADVFRDNQEVTYVKLPAGITVIAGESFKGCTALKSVYLPSTVKEIGAGAFENCTAMTQISIPKSVTAIGDKAFKGDARLQLVQLKDAQASELSFIGEEVFAGCESLEQIRLPQTTAGDSALPEDVQ